LGHGTNYPILGVKKQPHAENPQIMLAGQNQMRQLTKHKDIQLFIDFKAAYESHNKHTTNAVGTIYQPVEEHSCSNQDLNGAEAPEKEKSITVQWCKNVLYSTHKNTRL
jgi:predicted metal-dependent HD superfamily phosphohydrolase